MYQTLTGHYSAIYVWDSQLHSSASILGCLSSWKTCILYIARRILSICKYKLFLVRFYVWYKFWPHDFWLSIANIKDNIRHTSIQKGHVSISIFNLFQHDHPPPHAKHRMSLLICRRPQFHHHPDITQATLNLQQYIIQLENWIAQNGMFWEIHCLPLNPW